MSESEPKPLNPLKQMKAALRIWIFSIQVNKAIANKKLDLSSLPKEISLRSGPIQYHYKVEIPLTSYNAISRNTALACTGTCAIAFDEAMNIVFDKKGKSFPADDTDLTAARAIIVQIRNAFAHEPANPRWEVRNLNSKYLSKKFRVVELNLEVDLKILNGKNFAIKHIGGWKGYLDLLLYCITQVEQYKHDKIYEIGIKAREQLHTEMKD